MQQQQRNYIQFFVNSIVGGLVVLILAVGGKQWSVKLDRLQSLKEKRGELADSLKTQREEIAKIKENTERFNTDRDFVEELARKSRRVSRSDIVFVFDENHKD